MTNTGFIFPCNVGDPVYWITNFIKDRQLLDYCLQYNSEADYGIVELTVDGFYYDANKGFCLTVKEIPFYTVFYLTVDSSIFFDYNSAVMAFNNFNVESSTDDTNINTLLPCPFCGTVPQISKIPMWNTRDGITHGYTDCYSFTIRCQVCGCSTNTVTCDTISLSENEAQRRVITAWNTRHKKNI